MRKLVVSTFLTFDGATWRSIRAIGGRDSAGLLAERGCPKFNLQIRSENAEVIAFYGALGYRTDDVVSLGKRLIND
jgi:hypothetical protein